MMDSTQIVTGERLQNVADIYIGTSYYFQYNPMFTPQIEKQKHLCEFDNKELYDNPRTVFCYGDLITEFSKTMDLFMNPFVLVTHNSDMNIVDNPTVNMILEHPKLIRWHGQNVGYIHPKLYFLPIGIANRQWPHGNLEMFDYIFRNYDLSIVKKKWAYMNFKIETNKEKRMKCYEALFNKVQYLALTNPMENLLRMMEYRYCICPEGNGLDTHRLWECFYLRVVPVLLKTPYSLNIKNETGLPMILLDSWSDFSYSENKKNEYEEFDFKSGQQHLTMKHYIKQIIA
jgi:hypothetical protein